jgi:AcrR family transcriptional regulator
MRPFSLGPRLTGGKTTSHIGEMPRHSVRDVIVETALSEFHRIGFAACSVDTITRAAGVPKGSFYNHFKSKEDLAVEVVAKYAAEAEWNSVTDPKLTPLDKLRAQFRIMGDVLVGHGYTRGCMIGNMGEELADHSEPMRAQVRASLGRCGPRARPARSPPTRTSTCSGDTSSTPGKAPCCGPRSSRTTSRSTTSSPRCSGNFCAETARRRSLPPAAGPPASRSGSTSTR